MITKKYLNRVKELIKEGQEVAKLEKPTKKNPEIKTIQDGDRLKKWLTNVENIINVIFRENDFQFKTFQKLKEKKTYYSSTVREIYGFLEGIADDIEKGLLFKHEFLIAGEIFENILEQAKELNTKGYKDAAAVMVRVIVENALKKLAQKEGIKTKQKAFEILNELKKKWKLDKAKCNEINSWLQLGNWAAHGDFKKYKKKRIEKLISDVEYFLNDEFKS